MASRSLRSRPRGMTTPKVRSLAMALRSGCLGRLPGPSEVRTLGAVTPVALGLVISAAVIHAGWNALAKRASDPLAFLWCAGVVGTVLYLPGVVLVLTVSGFRLAALPFVIATIVLHSV